VYGFMNGEMLHDELHVKENIHPIKIVWGKDVNADDEYLIETVVGAGWKCEESQERPTWYRILKDELSAVKVAQPFCSQSNDTAHETDITSDLSAPPLQALFHGEESSGQNSRNYEVTLFIYSGRF
jgi:hypothetical protein